MDRRSLAVYLYLLLLEVAHRACGSDRARAGDGTRGVRSRGVHGACGTRGPDRTHGAGADRAYRTGVRGAWLVTVHGRADAATAIAALTDSLRAVGGLTDARLGITRAESRHRVYAAFQLIRKLGYALILLHRCLMSLERGLNHLHGSTLTLSQLFQLHRVLLFLLQHLLVHHRSLAGLLFKLAHRLFDLTKLLTDIVVHLLKYPPLVKLGCETNVRLPLELSAIHRTKRTSELVKVRVQTLVQPNS